MLRRYSLNSIKNYVSAVRGLFEIASRKFIGPEEFNEDIIGKYVLRKVEKHLGICNSADSVWRIE